MSATTAAARTPCPDPQTLRKLLGDDLAPGEAGRVEEHVGACPDCQRVLQRLVGSMPDTVAGPLPEPPARAADEEPPDLPGYQLMGRIDAGGMGVVWRVRDPQFGRNLAVKVMKSWACASPGLVERFVGEAQVCGQLAHPFIVPVHAMGRLPDGRPYYTMRLVEGRTLAALLEGEPASVERRERLMHVFGQLCQAVAYAHARGVIHRDLKPDNVMVGKFGEVQLMDWGLAKVLGDARPGEGPGPPTAGPGDEDAARTRAGSVMGTPAYMPPEQARGEVAEVDQRSDVFSLGAVLCAVLSGAPPYPDRDARAARRRAGEADLGEALGRLRASGADPELVRLAERCLAPHKADRPADAGEVAAAVAAYVSGVEERLQQERLRREREQVQAAEERRRRRLWMGLAAAVLVAVAFLTAGLIVVNHLRGQEQAAKDLAQRHEREARTVLDELSSVVIDEWLSRQPELTPAQKEFLQKGLAQYEKFTRETGETPEGRAALAGAYYRVGTLRRQLGLVPEAEEALRQAVERSDALAEEFPAVTSHRRAAARASQALAVVLMDRGDYRQAAPFLDAAIRHQQEVVRQEGDDPSARGTLASLHLTRGRMLTELNEWDGAETSLGDARAILDEFVDAYPKVPDYRLDLARAHHVRAVGLQNRSRFDEAEAPDRRALALLKALVDDFPLTPQYRLHLSEAHTGLGITLWKRGRLDEARDAHGEAVSIQKALIDNFRSIPRYRQDLASSYNNLAFVLEDQGKLDDSVAATRQAIALREQLVKDSAGVHEYAVTLGGTYGNLAALLKDQGRAADSLEWYDKAVDTLEPALAKEDRHGNARHFLRNMYSGRAQALDRLGRHAEAAKDWDRAVPLDDGKRRLYYQARHALSLGDHARAVALAGEQARAPGVNGKTVFDCARVCGLAAAEVKEDPMLREQYAGRAVELLRQAVAAGYTGPRQDIAADEAFDALRGREDYRQLEKELKAGASAPGLGRK